MSFFLLLSIAALFAVAKLLFIVPSRLSHLPRAPLLPLLFSYLSLEPEDQRIRRLILPFANEKGEPVVLVWAFGMWVVHIIDYEVGQSAMKDKTWVRQLPPQDLLFWKFVGHQNLVFTNGDEWKRHSRVVTSVFLRPPPIRDFAAVAQRLLDAMHRDAGAGSAVRWDTLARRLTIDILSTTILGSDIRAIDRPHAPITSTYNRCMEGLTAPPYIFLPFLDKYFPRKGLVDDARYLRAHFSDLIKEKATNPGNDLISLMLAEPSFSEKDVLDNVSLFFVAGHETTAGALSSIIYYFATNPEHQTTARAEVTRVLAPPNSTDPTDTLDTTRLAHMPFLFACIQESMRMNNPSNFTLPRRNTAPTTLGKYPVPPGTLMCFSMAGVHHLERTWARHEEYVPERFVGAGSSSGSDVGPAGTAVGSGPGPAGRTAFFGAGLRQCPARHFAMWELRTVTALLLREFRWALPPGSVHRERVRNAFSFSTNLNLPVELGVVFEPVVRR